MTKAGVQKVRPRAKKSLPKGSRYWSCAIERAVPARSPKKPCKSKQHRRIYRGCYQTVYIKLLAERYSG